MLPETPAPLADFFDYPAPGSLNENHDVYGHPDSVVRVREVSRRPHGDEAQNEHHGAQTDGEDVEVDVVPYSRSGPVGVVSRQENCGGDEEEEHDGGYDSVPEDQGVVLSQGREAVAHSL